jgi:hypothetical protein
VRGSKETGGGALAAVSFTAAVIAEESPKFSSNLAEGGNACGGGIFLNGANRVRLRGAEFVANKIVVVVGKGHGGAVHIEDGIVQLTDGLFEGNIAKLSGAITALEVSGGGVSVGRTGTAVLRGVRFSSNIAGGIGGFDRIMADFAESLRSKRASQIDCQGAAMLEGCSFDDSIPMEALEGGVAGWWIVVWGDSGSIIIVDSSLTGTSPDQHALSLLGRSQGLLRRCNGINVQFNSSDPEATLGIVDSTFEPSLVDSSYVSPPECGKLVAGARVCDPRADCTLRGSGGVECRCVGDGLSTKVGSRDDGSMCAKTLSLSAQLQTPEIRVAIAKPGVLADAITLSLMAEGEAGVAGSFYITFRLQLDPATSADWIEHNGTVAPVSAFGSSLEWSQPVPTPVTRLELNAQRQEYSYSIGHAFKIKLRCENGTLICPRDGSLIEASIRFAAESEGSPISAAATVIAEVQATASCQRSLARVQLPEGGWFTKAALPIDAWLIDVDGMAITRSTPTVVVTIAGMNIRQLLQRQVVGTNWFGARLDAEKLGLTAGSYSLQVSLQNGWNATMDETVMMCTLLEQFLVLEESAGFSSLWTLVGSLIACALLVITVIYFVRKFAIKLQHLMRQVLTEGFQLVTGVSFELGDLCTDIYTSYLVVFEDGFVRSPSYKVYYMVFAPLCVVVSAACIVFRVRHAIEVYRKVHDVAVAADDADAAAHDQALIQNLDWEVLVCLLLCFLLCLFVC